MPHRHEFSEVYHKDAEKLVANLAFDQKKETDDSFLMKIQNLICYNTQINERANRTKVIEEWDFHHIEVANVPEQDLTIWRLNGKTQNEKKIDRIIVPLGQYYGVKNVMKFSRILHKKERLQNSIVSRVFMINYGIKDYNQYKLFERLKEFVKNGVVKDIDGWNREIEQYKNEGIEMNKKMYNEDFHSVLNSNKELFDRLSKNEKALIVNNLIEPQLYLAIKELILREYEIRKKLTIDDLLLMQDSNHHEIRIIYNFFISIGWVSD